MKEIVWSELSPSEQDEILRRPALRTDAGVTQQVRDIVNEVREKGDAALFDMTARFDGVCLSDLEVSASEWKRETQSINGNVPAAMKRAIGRLELFHRRQRPRDIVMDISEGARCWRQSRAIGRVGMYIPGGSAPLASTVLMVGVPAQLAGCPVRIMCTPPTEHGGVDRHVLLAAKLVGIQRVFKVGGAQAIAAMAYGTDSVPKVDKIFGPGNVWVTEAKGLCALDSNGAACDLLAGPSEVMVLADADATPAFVASDLLAQAEHGADSHVVLLTTSSELMASVARQLETMVARLPNADVARQSLARGAAISVDDVDQALAIANRYAPEHLILQINEAQSYMERVHAAGSVFLGPWSPEAVGDYASGTNHVLPTYGLARSHSGLGLESFLTQITFQELSPAALTDIGSTVETLAEIENLPAHKRSVSLRLRELGRKQGSSAAPVAPVHLARLVVQSMEPYESARSTKNLGATIYLDANELRVDPKNSAHGLDGNLTRYPEPQPEALITRLAKIYRTKVESLFLGRGVDDAIDALLRVFCEPEQDSIIICPPTYGVYETASTIQGAGIVRVPLLTNSGFALDVSSICSVWRPGTNLVFLCSPNNPTGNLMTSDDVTALCKSLAGRAVVVLDQAYIEFSLNDAWEPDFAELPNLVVLRTLSKAWGLAGARVGAALAHPQVIELLNKVRAPYPLSAPSIRLAEQALMGTGVAMCEEHARSVREQRAVLAKSLSELACVVHVFPSEANFLLVQTVSAGDFVANCQAAGIVVRNRNEPHIEECVRVSVGTPEENRALIAALRA